MLSRDEALELFSLPDESETSEDEAESSNEFVAELAPPDSSFDTNLGHVKANERNANKKLRKKTEKEPTRKQWNLMSKQMLLKNKLVKGGGESKPNISVGSPKSWDPEFTKKAVPRAVDCFVLYFDDEVIEMILEHANRAGAQRYTSKWAVLTKDELKAYFGLLLLRSVSP